MKNKALKIALLSGIAALAFSLTACSGNSENDPADSGNSQVAPPIGTVSPDNSQGEAITIPENGSENTTSSSDSTVPEETDEIQTEKTETELITETSAPDAELNPVVPPVEIASAAAKTAAEQVGKKFKLGGASPEQGFDNSGIVYYALTQNGIKCARTVDEMAKMGDKITMDQLKAGDIAFFNADDEERTLFVALYIGDGKAVISTNEDNPVEIINIATGWYSRNFAYGISMQG